METDPLFFSFFLSDGAKKMKSFWIAFGGITWFYQAVLLMFATSFNTL